MYDCVFIYSCSLVKKLFAPTRQMSVHLCYKELLFILFVILFTKKDIAGFAVTITHVLHLL